MDESEIEQKLTALVSDTNKDLDWAWSTYHDKLDKAEEKAFDGASEEMLQKQAIQMVRGSIVQGSRTGGPVEEVDILSIGHGGIREWNDGDGGKKDVLLAYGVVNPEDDPAGIGVMLCDSADGVDVHNLKSKFGTLESLKGHFQVEESDELTGVYVLRSSEDTRVEEDTSEMSDADKREFLHNFIEQDAEIANIAEHLSITNSDGYEAEFGADLKRLTCTVVDWYEGDGFNTYTVLDESVVDHSELGDDVVSDRGRTPGLTVWCPDEFFDYGNDSQLEIYGTISRSDDGQIAMNAVGIFPLIPFEKEERQQSGDSTDDSNVSEQTI
jgi:hypothetical protein